MSREDKIKQATGEAFYDWLENRPMFSMRDLIEDAVKAAVTEWLDKHGSEILQTLAARDDSR